MVKVVKFGGSSLASAAQFSKVGDIIRSDESRKYVIPSAPGKRNDKDTKVTDMLYQCYAAAEADEDFKPKLKKIKERYDSIINGLHLKVSLEEEFRLLRIKISVFVKKYHFRRIDKFISQICRHNNSIQIFSTGGRILFSGLIGKILRYNTKFFFQRNF